MKYQVRIYGDDALRRKAAPVDRVTDEIRQLAKDMLATMYASDGLGLAAEQVGRSEAICVIDVPPGHDVDETTRQPRNPDVRMPLVLINPRITDGSGEQLGQEGCLSFPEIFVQIKRSEEVEVTFTDLDGQSRTVRARGLLSRAIQHELDHLAGVLLVDRMTQVQKIGIAGRLKRLKKEGAPAVS